MSSKAHVLDRFDFSLAALIRAHLTDTWHSRPSKESIASKLLAEEFGETGNERSFRCPRSIFEIDGRRDMTVAGVQGSNNLVGSANAGYLPALQPASVTLKLGAQTYDAGRDHMLLPKGSTATSTSWLSGENAAITEGQPVIQQVSGSPKILAVLTEITHQMLKQSNAEEVVRIELRRAAGAALDAAALNGSGTSGQPLGIANTVGIGAFTGASLSQTALRDAQKDIADAITAGALGVVTTPAVAELLTKRQRWTGSSTALWEGPSHDGTVEGLRAMASSGMPAAVALVGDWSNVTIVSWGTPQIAVDPFTKFNSGIVAVRLLLDVDVLVTQPTGFTKASSIT